MSAENVNGLEFEIGDGEFSFESDYVAIRGNEDYTSLLRSTSMLQAQRIRATKDLDKLSLLEKEALERPEKFIGKLTSNDSFQMPGQLTVVDVPKIDFTKFKVILSDIPITSSFEKFHSLTVRGRIFDQSKPETFNQLWSCDEQRRLEELLAEYPPEPVEMRRFAKIARALGNRTTRQVASRIQKFFKKLHSVGMPVPGRLPKSSRQYTTKNHRLHKYSLRPSTFFPAHEVPVIIPEDDNEANELQRNGLLHSNFPIFAEKETLNEQNVVIIDKPDADNEEGDSKLSIIKLMKRVRVDKEKYFYCQKYSQHAGYVCDFCDASPIIGTRWHCNTCTENSVDFCSDCLIAQLMTTEPHPYEHTISGVRVISRSHLFVNQKNMLDDDFIKSEQNKSSNISYGTNILDKNYALLKFSNCEPYNYLDPNFQPDLM